MPFSPEEYNMYPIYAYIIIFLLYICPMYMIVEFTHYEKKYA